ADVFSKLNVTLNGGLELLETRHSGDTPPVPPEPALPPCAPDPHLPPLPPLPAAPFPPSPPLPLLSVSEVVPPQPSAVETSANENKRCQLILPEAYLSEEARARSELPPGVPFPCSAAKAVDARLRRSRFDRACHSQSAPARRATRKAAGACSSRAHSL